MNRKWKALRRSMFAEFAVATVGCSAAATDDALEPEEHPNAEAATEGASFKSAPSLRYLEITTSGGGRDNLPKDYIYINEQHSAFTVFTPDFNVEATSKDARDSADMSCQLNIKAKAPKRWRYGTHLSGSCSLAIPDVEQHDCELRL